MKKHSKTFIIFSPAFPADETDSTWLPSLQTFVMAINRNSPELNVIIFAFQYPYLTKAYTWYNNTVMPFNGFYKGRAARFLMWMKILNEVRKIRSQYDILGIFSQWCTECTFVAKYISEFFRLQYYCWIHGGDARATNTYVKRIRPKPSSLIAMSDFLRNEFYLNHKILPQYVIANGIDISLFGAPPVKKDIDIIGVGAFSILKQYDLFIRIVAELRKNIPGIKAMLCGDGDEREHIEKLMHELSVKDHIKLTGFVAHTESLKMMQRAKILLHPSSYEGFSSACLEALYAGAHVISFTKPMNHAIKNWYVVKTKEEMLLKALAILQNPDITFEKVLVYSNDEAAKKVMQLFGYNY